MSAVNFKMTYNGGAAQYSAALRAKLSAVVKKTARDVHAQAVVEITQGEDFGRIYSHHGVKHQASAPDEAPASDTGNLINSITVTDDSDLQSTIEVGAEYGLYLEMGTRECAEALSVPCDNISRASVHSGLRESD